MSIEIYLLFAVLAVVLLVGYKLFRLIMTYFSEESKTKRAVDRRKKQARDRNLFGKIEFIFRYAHVTGNTGQNINRGTLCLYYDNGVRIGVGSSGGIYFDSDSSSDASVKVWRGHVSDESLVFWANEGKDLAGVARYCSGTWEEELDSIYRDAKRDFPNQLKMQKQREAEVSKKKYGL